ncbi:hypothetical protein B0H11DRAFT_2289004 [Mycena galericulata]|nr:hypothetical protein B0H11DRAFT_2289216 [Mycena galericulata]KAJ7451475.1 hypothetical protein B0H11DRAFT_2289004 [Mycena galericulata]
MAPTPEEIAAYNAELRAAMLADSPEAPAPPGRQPQKRKRANTNATGDGEDSGEDDNEDDELPLTVIPGSSSPSRTSSPQPNNSVELNRNTLAFARQYATHKRLKPSQITEVEAFAGDAVATRQIKLFSLMLSVDSKLEAIVTTKPDFKILPPLDKNIRQLALGITVSSKLSSYKGERAKKHLLNILKKKRFELPPGIEFIASDWAVVKSRAEYQLTQVRALFKKFLKASMPPGVPATGHTNIFTLGQKFVKDTDTVLTVELCSRIALMRQEFKLYPGDDFWDKLDLRLVWMREQAEYDENKIAKMFKKVLNDDRKAHGKSADYKLPEDVVIDAWQLSVDESIDADATAD